MKTWNCQTKNKKELTEDLMFEEIMKLRKEAAGLATELHSVCTAVKECPNASKYVKTVAKEAMDYRRNL